MAKLIRKYGERNGERYFKGYYGRWHDSTRRPVQKEHSLRTKDEQQARLKLAQLELREISGEWDPWKDLAPKEGVMLSDAVRLYLRFRDAEVRKGNLSQRSRRSDGSVLELFDASAPIGLVIAHVQQEHVLDFLESTRLSESSYDTYLARLSGFFAWCHERGFVRENPAVGIKRRLRRDQRHGSFPYLTREEYTRLIRTIEVQAEKDGLKEGEVRWMLDVVKFMVGTGLRPSEMAHLQWHWITDLYGVAFIHIRNRRDEFRPKWGKERSVPLAGEALAIARRLAADNDTGYVFRSRRGRRRDREHLNVEYVSRRFLHFRKLAKLPPDIHLHSLRHTFASWLVIAGVDLYRVQRLLGHRSVETTMRYAHLAPHNLRADVEKVFGSGSGMGPVENEAPEADLRKLLEEWGPVGVRFS